MIFFKSKNHSTMEMVVCVRYFEYKNKTHLSNEIYKLNICLTMQNLKRDIVKYCIWYNPQTKFCLPNLNQNLEIAEHRECKLLSERNKITSKRRHQLVYSPARYDTKE